MIDQPREDTLDPYWLPPTYSKNSSKNRSCPPIRNLASEKKLCFPHNIQASSFVPETQGSRPHQVDEKTSNSEETNHDPPRDSGYIVPILDAESRCPKHEWIPTRKILEMIGSDDSARTVKVAGHYL